MRADRRRRGISLLEATTGLAIVGMTAVAALAAAGVELHAAERAQRALVAESLAIYRLDLLDLLSANELEVLPDSVAHGRFDPPLDGYRWETAASNREREAGVYDVTIHIMWDSGAYTIHSAKYRRPLVVSR